MAEIRNILACDTSTSTLHIALKCEEGFEERMIAGGFQHSEDLLQEITYMLERRNLKVADLDLLVCTRGPGSFTSLRDVHTERFLSCKEHSSRISADA